MPSSVLDAGNSKKNEPQFPPPGFTVAGEADKETGNYSEVFKFHDRYLHRVPCDGERRPRRLEMSF